MAKADETDAGGALVVISTMAPAVAFAPGAVLDILAQIEAAARAEAEKLDISTSAGRSAIASLAYKVARTKTAYDNMGKDLVEGWKTQAKTIDAERRAIRDKLDALKDEIRKPLTEFEEAEERRVTGHEVALAALQSLRLLPVDACLADVDARIGDVPEMGIRNWQEFAKRADVVRRETLDILNAARLAIIRQAEQAAEAARQKAEQDERDRQEAARLQAEREARLMAEAAERARLEAEAKAEAARQQVLAAAEAARLRAEQEAQAAARAAAEAAAAELRRVEQAAAAERQRMEVEAMQAETAHLRAERAEREAAYWQAMAEKRARQAARDAEAAVVAAVEGERQQQQEAQKRADEIAAAAKKDADDRAADKAHRGRINGEALADLVGAGLDDKQARAAVIAIASGKVRNVAITY